MAERVLCASCGEYEDECSCPPGALNAFRAFVEKVSRGPCMGVWFGVGECAPDTQYPCHRCEALRLLGRGG